jgi:beta-lactamase class A
LATRQVVRRVKRRKPASQLTLFLQKAFGVATLGIGTGLIISLSLVTRPNAQNSSVANQPPTAVQTSEMAFGRQSELAALVQFPLRQALTPLQERINALAAQYKEGTVGVFVLDLDTGEYVNVNGDRAFMAASTIKLPLLLYFFQDVDLGKVALDEDLIMEPEFIVGEAGRFQYQSPGTAFSALETATQMITVSDNTATNMIIARLGGVDALNRRFTQSGFLRTTLQSSLPDVEGTNVTSPIDLANILLAIEQADGLSVRSRDRVLRIMDRVINKQLLPSGLGQGAEIAHKTGTIGRLLADAGIIDTPNGKRYLAVIMVERPFNDLNARSLIQDISAELYTYFSTSESL